MERRVISVVILLVFSLSVGCGDDEECGADDGLAVTRTAVPPATGSPTFPPSPSPTPSATPLPPEITHLGIMRADDVPLTPTFFDDSSRAVYVRSQGQGITLIIEAKSGPSGRQVGLNAFDSGGELPDLQILVSRPLGDGSSAVCDIDDPQGGVPPTDPLEFSDDPEAVAAINDMGCRVDDGAGSPFGRPSSPLACTESDDPSGFGFGFVAPDTSVQFCLPIAKAWAFAGGDTIVKARVRDTAGQPSAPREIVVRVTGPSGAT